MMKNKYGKLILILGLALTLCVVAACQKKTLTYTWEEFQGLTAQQQMEFQNSFKSIEEFEAWMKSVNPKEETTAAEVELPWEKGGKQPSEYTWAEFEALDAGQQMKFQQSFGNLDKFDEWMAKVNPTEPETEPVLELPWEKGGKQPSEYTWAEFEALDAGQQMKFQESFGNLEKFNEWMEKVNPTEPETEPALELPWEKGGKQPSEYTWAEFEALDAGQQMKFQESFGDLEKFNEWMQKVNPEEETTAVEPALPWENGGKAPEEYTWAEFEALDAGAQIKFQTSFATEDGFDKWLAANEPKQ